MSRLPTSQKIIKVLLRHGFTFVSQKGRHRKYKSTDKIVIVPHPRKEIPIGTFRSIVRQSGLTVNNFK